MTQEAGLLELVVDVDLNHEPECQWNHDPAWNNSTYPFTVCTQVVVAYAETTRCQCSQPLLVCASAVTAIHHTEGSWCTGCTKKSLPRPLASDCWKTRPI